MYTLSIILNLHRENELAQKTIDNLNKILIAKNSWQKIELIAILDNSNKKTKDIVIKNKNIFNHIEEVMYGDLAMSRNHGIDIATSKFVLFADGDDYCSHNILQSLYKVFYKHYHKKKNLEILDDHQHIAVFPDSLLWFPDVSKMKYYESNNFMIQNNKFTHCYISRIAIYRGLLKKYPIRTNTPPYGYEDWDLNNRLLENGIQFKMADYTLYYRKENTQSLLAGQIEKKHLVRNSDTYHSDNIHIKIQKKVKFRNITIGKVLEYAKYYLKVNQNANNEVSIESDVSFLKSYNEIDLNTKNILFHSSEHYTHQISIQVEIYQQLLILLANHHHIHISDIRTKPREDTFLISIDSDIINWNSLSEDDQLHIFIKAIINSQIKTIYIDNSDFAMKSLKYHSLMYQEYNIEIISI
jgi:hypothetical protein